MDSKISLLLVIQYSVFLNDFRNICMQRASILDTFISYFENSVLPDQLASSFFMHTTNPYQQALSFGLTANDCVMGAMHMTGFGEQKILT